MTDKGTEVVVALDRSEQLADGAVLSLESDRAIVVRMTEERWLRITPRDLDCALETGYFAGNLHWRVRFEPGAILVAIEGPTALHGAIVDSHHDHRLAMALAIAGMVADGDTTITDTACIADSYPGFEASLARLGASL